MAQKQARGKWRSGERFPAQTASIEFTVASDQTVPDRDI
jgi:hypothetical protein